VKPRSGTLLLQFQNENREVKKKKKLRVIGLFFRLDWTQIQGARGVRSEGFERIQPWKQRKGKTGWAPLERTKHPAEGQDARRGGEDDGNFPPRYLLRKKKEREDGNIGNRRDSNPLDWVWTSQEKAGGGEKEKKEGGKHGSGRPIQDDAFIKSEDERP